MACSRCLRAVLNGILCGVLQPGTLAAQLLGIRSQSEEGYETTLTVASRVPLEGEELEAYEAARAAAEEQEAIAAAAALAAAAAEGGQMVAGADGMPLRANSLVISKLVLGSSGGMVQVSGHVCLGTVLVPAAAVGTSLQEYPTGDMCNPVSAVQISESDSTSWV